MQSILGALLTLGYGTAMATAVAQSPNAAQVTDTIESQLQKSFAGAESVAQQYPQYAQAIVDAAKQSFLEGANWAYAAGILAILIGAAVTWFCYPNKTGQRELLTQYEQQDSG